jgi:hypothetical protein
MTAPDRTYDPIRFQRGTRGLAAFVAGLTGFVVLGAALIIVPSLDLSPLVATWAVILGTVAGIAHLVAVEAVARRAPDDRPSQAHPRAPRGRARLTNTASGPSPTGRSPDFGRVSARAACAPWIPSGW